MNQDQPIFEVSSGARTLKIYVDEVPENPRRWHNLGTMVCWNDRYALGDKHGFETPEDFLREVNSKDALILPLYFFDHSDVAMNTTGFAFCDPERWDWGQVGFIYVTKERVRAEWGVKKITPDIKKRVFDVLNAEVREYSHYLNGDVYGFVVEENGTVIDSCWSFYGSDWMTNGLAEEAGPEWAELIRRAA